jgi:hypothetical protein
MNPVQIFMITVFFGSIGMIVAIVLCRRSEEGASDTFRDCLLWGTGFFVAMCLQVLALSRF